MNNEAMLAATCSDNTMKRKSSRRQLHWHYVHWRTPHCILILVILCYAIGIGKANTSLRICTKDDFHYEYTECDSKGSRWLVSVPKTTECTGGVPNAPVRGRDCDYTCEAGTFLNMQDASDQGCQPCPAGTYSLGGGVRFDEWTTLPAGFGRRTSTFSMHRSSYGYHAPHKKTSCDSSSGWQLKGTYLSVSPIDCEAFLMFTANLVMPGQLRFTYQHTDGTTPFIVYVRNSECRSVYGRDRQKYMRITETSKWKTKTIQLTAGKNVIYWKALGMNQGSEMKKPTLIQMIEIKGLAFSSQCSKCRNGTFSGEKESFCTQCAANTYSLRGASGCTPCDAVSQYSDSGASQCIARPACTDRDYYTYSSTCDSNNQTRVVAVWNSPRVCRDDIAGATHLPSPASPRACPPCNRGMRPLNGSCVVCAAGLYSEDGAACLPCPLSTAPQTAIYYRWWNNLPAAANLTSRCIGFDERDCASDKGWLGSVEFMQTGSGHADAAYLVLMLNVSSGFVEPANGLDFEIIVARITFVFELDCVGNCSLIFLQENMLSDSSIVEHWHGKTKKQSYVYDVTMSGPATFVWAFQKASETSTEGQRLYTLRNDFAKIYVVNVTNTVGGGAVSCKACPRGSNQEGCRQCEPGHYIDVNTTQCVRCPVGTVLGGGSDAWGEAACTPCGEGLHPDSEQVKCVASCLYHSPAGHRYDFRPIAGIRELDATKLFTSEGIQFYHVFNISLCAANTLVTCRRNVTYVEAQVQAKICRVTVMPSSDDSEVKYAHLQPVSLGDVLVNITTNGTSLNMAQRMSDEGFTISDEYADLDVHFVYTSLARTDVCQNGRSMVITLRCDPTDNGNGTLLLPPMCSDGTCDGCNFHMVWLSQHACPRCIAADYHEFREECKKGQQVIQYQGPKYCEHMLNRLAVCSVFPWWVQIAVGTGAVCVMLMCSVLIYCWKRNRKLEYSYMKLVTTASSDPDGECQLPAVETCALDDDEDDDEQHFDAIDFKGRKLFNKLKSIGKKSEDDNPFENIRLSEKIPLT